MAQENPFRNWTQGTNPPDEVIRLEDAFLQDRKSFVAIDLTEKVNKNTPSAAAVSHISGMDTATLEQMASLIAENLAQWIEQKNMIADRIKLEELKVDNNLMARHIYSLLQKRGIQDKQIEHLQTEQKRWTKLFWKLYIRNH